MDTVYCSIKQWPLQQGTVLSNELKTLQNFSLNYRTQESGLELSHSTYFLLQKIFDLGDFVNRKTVNVKGCQWPTRHILSITCQFNGQIPERLLDVHSITQVDVYQTFPIYISIRHLWSAIDVLQLSIFWRLMEVLRILKMKRLRKCRLKKEKHLKYIIICYYFFTLHILISKK